MTERTEQITGLRELADWLEAHPEAPLQYGQEFQVFILGDDREVAVADLSDVGATLGIAPARQYKTSPHLRVAVQFSGDISYAVIACDVPRELYEDRADQDITQGEGEVGASSAVEAPTAPPADEPVWVAAERKGIAFHALSDRSNLTDCRRSAARGSRLPRADAEQFAQPCPRCYPPTAVGAV
jgi:hypothetical protein